MYLVCIENNTQMYVVNAEYMTFKYINCFNVCILHAHCGVFISSMSLTQHYRPYTLPTCSLNDTCNVLIMYIF